MIKETIQIPLTEEFKEKAQALIDSTLEKVFNSSSNKISSADKKKVKNLALDQVNVSVTNKINSKTLWVFNIEKNLPVIVERDPSVPRMGAIVKGTKQVGFYTMKPNLSWTLTKTDNGASFTEEEFKEKVLSMFLEDIETAAFYGALSFVGDVS